MSEQSLILSNVVDASANVRSTSTSSALYLNSIGVMSLLGYQESSFDAERLEKSFLHNRVETVLPPTRWTGNACKWDCNASFVSISNQHVPEIET